MLEELEPLSVLRIELLVLTNGEFDEPLSKLEVGLVDAGADEEIIVEVELLVAGGELDMELLLDIMELELPVVGGALMLETTELALLVAVGELEVILDIMELELLATCDVVELLG